jgi:cell division protein FtsI (penicillin-binding protein 3)
VTAEQLFNKASLGSYEFGSVFKILTLAIALETKTTTIHDLYDISSLQIGKFSIQDFSNTSGMHTVAEIFARSSNKGVAKMALAVGRKNFQHYLRQLGLSSQVITEIPEKAAPSFALTSNWSDISMATVSYGYGISTSVLNLIQAVVPTINGGKFYPLTLVKKDVETNGETIFSAKTSSDVRKLMRLVVSSGTGKRADVPGYLVAGKSGTANKIGTKGYAKNLRRSSFISIFPSINPQYLIYVMIDEPKPNKNSGGYATGGVVAAPAVAQIISRIAALKSMVPYDMNAPEVIQQTTIDDKINGV